MAFSDLIRNTMDAFLSKQYMADGLEKVEDDVDKANSKADSAVSTANNANNRVDNIVEHGGSAESTEVIDSLHDNITGTTYGHLGERLDAHSASLAESMNIFKPVFSHQYKKTFIHFGAGIDSLTNGASGSCWVDKFRERAYGEMGCGGLGYIGFDNTQIVEFGSWNTNLPTILGTEYEKYSLDAKGIYRNDTVGGDHLYLYFTNRNFKYAKLFYLKQPSGGSFQIRWTSDDPSTRVTIDTSNGDYDLGVYDLQNENNASRNGTIDLTSFSGNVVVFGVFLTNDDGIIVTKLGKGGDQFAKHANLDSTFRKKWLDILQFDYYLLNAGTNDAHIIDETTYDTMLHDYLQAFLDNTVNIILISPNRFPDDIGNAMMAKFEQKLISYAKDNKCAFFSHYSLLGNTYADAVSYGYMGDGPHPNDFGNQKISNHWLDYFGLSKIGNIGTFEKNWENDDSDSTTEIIHELTDLNIINLASGTSKNIYLIGLEKQYTTALLEMTIAGQVIGGYTCREKVIRMTFKNNTSSNQVTAFSTPTIEDRFHFVTGTTTVVDFTITPTIVNNQLQISLAPNSTPIANMNFTISGKVILLYNINTGQAVYEN